MTDAPEEQRGKAEKSRENRIQHWTRERDRLAAQLRRAERILRDLGQSDSEDARQ